MSSISVIPACKPGLVAAASKIASCVISYFTGMRDGLQQSCIISVTCKPCRWCTLRPSNARGPVYRRSYFEAVTLWLASQVVATLCCWLFNLCVFSCAGNSQDWLAGNGRKSGQRWGDQKVHRWWEGYQPEGGFWTLQNSQQPTTHTAAAPDIFLVAKNFFVPLKRISLQFTLCTAVLFLSVLYCATFGSVHECDCSLAASESNSHWLETCSNKIVHDVPSVAVSCQFGLLLFWF